MRLDAMNAFVHAMLDELVYMRNVPGYGKPGTVLKLRKAIYGLRRSPLLWQKTFTNALTKLGFTEVPQEPCIAIRDGIPCWFFVGDFVFPYRKEKRAFVGDCIHKLQQQFKIRTIGDCEWFLGMHIIRDRKTRKLWLSQESYIDEIADRFGETSSRSISVPITQEELLSLDKTTNEDKVVDIKGYQGKTGSILFAAISTRPDIAFLCRRSCLGIIIDLWNDTMRSPTCHTIPATFKGLLHML